MKTIEFLFNKIFDLMAMKIDVLGYDIALMEVLIFVMLGRLFISIVCNIFD